MVPFECENYKTEELQRDLKKTLNYTAYRSKSLIML